MATPLTSSRWTRPSGHRWDIIHHVFLLLKKSIFSFSKKFPPFMLPSCIWVMLYEQDTSHKNNNPSVKQLVEPNDTDIVKTLPKAQRTRGLSSAYQRNKFLAKSWSNSKIQPFDQTSTSKSWPNIHFITSPSLSSKILTKLQFQKFRLNFNFKLLAKPCAQSLNKI